MEKVWNDIGGKREGILSIDKFEGYETEERIEIRERLALRNKVKEEEHLKVYGGLREEIGMKTCLHGPMDYAKMLQIAISSRGPGHARKKKNTWYTSREEERKMPRCALVAKQ